MTGKRSFVRKPRKLNPNGRKFQQLALDLLINYAPPVNQCAVCWQPVLECYLCGNCGASETTKRMDPT